MLRKKVASDLMSKFYCLKNKKKGAYQYIEIQISPFCLTMMFICTK